MARAYGYSRPTVSLPDPRTHAQELASAGAEIILVENNTSQARRGLRERRRLLDEIGAGDKLILQSLDRLGTNFEDVLRCFEILVDRGVDITILDVGFETAGTPNAAYRDLLKLLAGARAALNSEAIKLSLAAARAKGGKKAGKPAFLTDDQWPDIQARITKTSLGAVAEELGISRQTLWTYRRRMAKQEGAPAS